MVSDSDFEEEMPAAHIRMIPMVPNKKKLQKLKKTRATKAEKEKGRPVPVLPVPSVGDNLKYPSLKPCKRLYL